MNAFSSDTLIPARADDPTRITWHVEEIPWTPLTGLFIRKAGYKTVVDADFTGNAYSIELTTVGPGGASPTHVEPHAHVFYILSGHAEVTAGDETTEVRAGSVSPIAAGVPHSFRNLGDDALMMLVIYHPPRKRREQGHGSTERPAQTSATANVDDSPPASSLNGVAAVSNTLQVQVKSISYEAEGIHLFDLRPAPPLLELPAFTAGSHIDLHLPNGLIRSYSLLNAQADRHRYLIAVNKDAASRGGSRFLHEKMRPGDILTISHPRNNFELNENAPHTVFIAGGIGITPLWSMIQRLEQLARSWELHYACRTRKNAGLLARLHALDAQTQSRLHLAFDQEPDGAMLDLASIVAATPAHGHLYCCGPLPMLQAFEEASASRAPETVHVEYFATKDKPHTFGGFTVELARSGRIIPVPKGKTILETLLDLGIDTPYSCREGVCGTCEVAVLSGVPDHRDLVLSQAEKAANSKMLICCSGAKSERLVIDL